MKCITGAGEARNASIDNSDLAGHCQTGFAIQPMGANSAIDRHAPGESHKPEMRFGNWANSRTGVHFAGVGEGEWTKRFRLEFVLDG